MLLRFNDSALLREWTVQSLIVVPTHLVLVSGKLVLQKKLFWTAWHSCSSLTSFPVFPGSDPKYFPDSLLDVVALG